MTEYNETALAPDAQRQTEASDAIGRHVASHEEDWFKPCAVIPVHDQQDKLAKVLRTLRDEDIPCVLVDDGSSPEAARLMDELAREPGVQLVRHAHNQGKGGAMVSGLREAARLGYSHALQIEVDGRYDLSAVGQLLDRASQAPDALVCGYDPSERSLGQAFARLYTLSASIRDVRCSLRVYPLATTLAFANRIDLAARTSFDAEILVRLHWENQPMVWLPTSAIRPAESRASVQGCLALAAMHARLFLGMLMRAPALLLRRLND
ncbi:glycosyltransferase [Stutzerimonas urumqiensis]|uniref:glycosyltransferase family 2 protein n=1 Tax=Stutzerimonas urumqiensis TaxID=638269 RepID=UPI003BAC2D34